MGATLLWGCYAQASGSRESKFGQEIAIILVRILPHNTRDMHEEAIDANTKRVFATLAGAKEITLFYTLIFLSNRLDFGLEK